MNHHNGDPEFDNVIAGGYAIPPQNAYIDPNPYGAPAQPVKPGLTKRGKAALAIGATVIAGGGMLGWQHYSAQQAAADVKAQEIALKQQELRLEELRELNKANTASQKLQTTVDTARQKKVDACVNDNKGLVGKQLGATYRSVLEDCQAQYPATTSTGDMQAVSDTTSSGGGGVNTGLLIGGGVLVLGLAVAAKKSTKSNPA
jgi:hypothetical protein